MYELDTRTFIKKEQGFDIFFQPFVEDESLTDLYSDDTPEQIAEMQKDLNSYNSVLFVAKVSAHKAGIELGTDYLGGCHYGRYEDFYREESGYFADMVQNAINEAKKTIELINK